MPEDSNKRTVQTNFLVAHTLSIPVHCHDAILILFQAPPTPIDNGKEETLMEFHVFVMKTVITLIMLFLAYNDANMTFWPQI